MDYLIRPITLNTLGSLNTTYTHCVSPFLTVFTLQNTWIHVCTTYHSNETSNIKTSVDNWFGLGTSLDIPDIDPDDGHIWFQRNFDDFRPRSENNIVEDVVILENFLNIVRQNMCVCLFIQKRNSYNLEVGFWLGELRSGNLIIIIMEWTLDIFLNLL